MERAWQQWQQGILLRLLSLVVLVALSSLPITLAQDSESPTIAPTELYNATNATELPLDLNIDYELESILALRWKLLKPRIAYDGLRFDLVFTTSDFIREEMIVYTLYDGQDCSAGANIINDAGFFDTELTGDGTPVGGGISTRQMTLSTSIVPEMITKSSSYEEFGDVATIEFCIRFGVYSDDVTINPEAMEINYLETTITLIVDLTDNFAIQDPIVDAKDAARETANDAFFVEGFICTEDGVPPQDVVPLFQGQTVRVCVQPTPQALAVGFRMRRIDSFTFTQGYITQDAIVDRRVSINGLTQLWCEEGSIQCAFETLLLAYFYTGPSLVSGTGVATLQFGSNRRLRSLQGPRETEKKFDLHLFGVKSVQYKYYSSANHRFSSILFAFLPAVILSLILLYL